MCQIEMLVRDTIVEAAFPRVVWACVERVLLLQEQDCLLKVVIKAGLHRKIVSVANVIE